MRLRRVPVSILLALGLVTTVSVGSWALSRSTEAPPLAGVWQYSHQADYQRSLQHTILRPGETVSLSSMNVPVPGWTVAWLYEAELGPESVSITARFGRKRDLGSTEVWSDQDISLSDLATKHGTIRFYIENLANQAQRFRMLRFQPYTDEYDGPAPIAYVAGLCVSPAGGENELSPFGETVFRQKTCPGPLAP